jgi:hypothetical protein
MWCCCGPLCVWLFSVGKYVRFRGCKGNNARGFPTLVSWCTIRHKAGQSGCDVSPHQLLWAVAVWWCGGGGVESSGAVLVLGAGDGSGRRGGGGGGCGGEVWSRGWTTRRVGFLRSRQLECGLTSSVAMLPESVVAALPTLRKRLCEGALDQRRDATSITMGQRQQKHWTTSTSIR